MPIHNLNINPSILCWKIEESENQLLSMVNLNEWEKKHINNHKRPQRRKELITSRILAQQYLSKVHIEYHNRKPILINSSKEISISNTKDYVAVMIQNEKTNTGIDIQYYSDTVLRVKHKFLHPTEKSLFDIDDNEVLNIIWSAKETLYKAYSKDKLEFKKQLIVTTIDKVNNKIEGVIKYSNDKKASFKLGLHVKDEFILTYFKE